MPGLFILLGPSGCGKTSWVTRNFWDYTYLVPRQPGSVWFDEVRHDDELALFDEFKNSITVEGLLALVDYAPVRQPKKGGFILPHFECVVLTSNAYTIGELWPRPDGHGSYLTPAQLNAIQRRVTDGHGAIVNFWNADLTGKDPTVQSPEVQPVLQRLQAVRATRSVSPLAPSGDGPSARNSGPGPVRRGRRFAARNIPGAVQLNPVASTSAPEPPSAPNPGPPN